MRSLPPSLIAINHDDYHAKFVGRLPNGNQFFLTSPFEPARKDPNSGGEFNALFIFNPHGDLLDARIDAFGPRATANAEQQDQQFQRWLDELGDVTFCRIEVAPFSLQKFGITFGLVLREPDDDDDPWAVELMPGNYMAFFEPWDSGDYDT